MSMQNKHILHITRPTPPRTFVLIPGQMTLGRSQDNDIRLDHPLVSRHHARIELDHGCVSIQDLGSQNGTLVNGQPVAEKEIVHEGDVIQVGHYYLTYERWAEDEKSHLAKDNGDNQLPPTGNLRSPGPPPAPIVPPGLSVESHQLIHYLPDILHSHFMRQFLAIFEATWCPLEWNIGNFDLYLDPQTTPYAFLPWLATWFAFAFDDSWNEGQQREFCMDAHRIFARLGTLWALSRTLEIYTGVKPEIDDQNQLPFSFHVQIPPGGYEVKRTLVEVLIKHMKPTHTSYSLSMVDTD